MFCGCGCGKEVNTGKRYAWGHNGFHLTEEQELKRRECVSKAKKGKPCSEPRRQKLIKYFENPENRKKNSDKIKEIYKKNPDRFDNFATVHQMLRDGKLQSGNKEKKASVESRKRYSEAAKEKWKNPEYVKKVRTRRTPSGLEINFIDLIVENKWNLIYVGDFQLNIGGRYPDFWDGDKRLIEVFGHYHINSDEAKERARHYKNYGYDCLVLWASDLNKNKRNQTIEKVFNFLEEDNYVC